MRRGAPVLITQSRTISPPPLATVVNMKHAASATSACFGCALITITNDDIMSLFKAPRGLTFRSQIQARATDPLTATATSPGLARRDLTRPSSAVCHSSSSSSSSPFPALALAREASTVQLGITTAGWLQCCARAPDTTLSTPLGGTARYPSDPALSHSFARRVMALP
eukprot:CAMPEP_0173379734 /NCGR_PEP_ID=MMETSP1356-20130122/2562_1 /TAXON_ID=77927 ORGANISM="Hemiselmis virescens, Strain PCC157" /NCGR_SAMPLE_ID=MMETSP1356 /ASSEMBLY_ACC=CAM_ASM_000847 /LENGTH=167 /DNA_ID=CAMNT_0014333123 /DNA_START=186 /DNA_END=685 /DNA_ORIENTATION=-